MGLECRLRRADHRLGALFPSGHGTQRSTCRAAACRRPLGTSEQPRHPRTEPRLTCLGPDLRNRSCPRCQRDYRPKFAWTPLSRPADSFSSFGQPVVAPASGTVVGAYDKARDHRSRTSWPGLVYLVIEGALRELTGPKRLLGNHVVLDLGNNTYAAMAHLRRGSVLVLTRSSSPQVAPAAARARRPSRSTDTPFSER